MGARAAHRVPGRPGFFVRVRPCRKRQDSVPVDDVARRRSLDGLSEPRVGEDLGPLAEREVGGDDQRAALVAFGQGLGKTSSAAPSGSAR